MDKKKIIGAFILVLLLAAIIFVWTKRKELFERLNSKGVVDGKGDFETTFGKCKMSDIDFDKEIDLFAFESKPSCEVALIQSMLNVEKGTTLKITGMMNDETVTALSTHTDWTDTVYTLEEWLGFVSE